MEEVSGFVEYEDIYEGGVDREKERRLTRAQRTLLAQLRTGACPRLMKTRALYGWEDNGVCRRCGEDIEDVRHVILECSELEEARARFLGQNPTLSILARDPEAVVAFLEASRALLPEVL